ncbi:recombinase family protein [Micromonospora marina]|uniref:recombinase family protein n=1 Tax=Micromonospora marina TaxID=307120 RepID=UPI0034512818
MSCTPRGIVLEILTGVCTGVHRPDGATIADRLLFAVAALAAELEPELIRERTLDGLRAAAAQGRRGGRPVAVAADQLDVARARLARGESVTAIAAHLGVAAPRCTGPCNPGCWVTSTVSTWLPRHRAWGTSWSENG